MSVPLTTSAITPCPAPETPPPASAASPPVPRRRRPYLLLTLTVLGIALLGLGCFHLWLKYTTPEPPVVDLAGLDEEVVEAIQTGQKLVRAQPRNPKVWGQLGGVLRAHEFNAASNLCFERAAKLDPRDGRWPYLIAIELLSHDPDAALPHLRRAVELSGEETAPRMRLGEVLLDRGEVDEAEALFRAVLDKQPDEPRANLNLGQIALRRNDLEGALTHLRRAAAHGWQAKAIHAALAQVYHQLGDEKAAEQERRILAGLLENWAWPDPARDFIRRSWTGLRARMSTIDQYDKTGYHEEAVVLARQTVQRYPDSALARLVLGEMLNRAKNSVAAEPVLREAIRLDPRRTKAHFELGYAQQAQGKLRDAVSSYRQALELQPDLALAHYNLALCLTNLQQFADAEKEYRAAIHYRPGDTEALLGLVIVLGRQGRYPDAQRHLEEAAHAAPADPRPAQLKNELLTQMAKEEKEKQQRMEKPKP
jgi:Flp pilus assembly protein TadD